jgi:ABC-type multidrug transport system fused ATPase/permease subunit
MSSWAGWSGGIVSGLGGGGGYQHSSWTHVAFLGAHVIHDIRSQFMSAATRIGGLLRQARSRRRDEPRAKLTPECCRTSYDRAENMLLSALTIAVIIGVMFVYSWKLAILVFAASARLW